jgi:hypothetical protein
MSAKAFTIEDILIGTRYRSHSRNFEGVITHASKREGIWYGEGLEAYVVQVRPTYGLSDRYATIAVRVGE